MDQEIFKLAEQLGELLKSRGQMIATAESCTGGWIAEAITDIPGSSAWFDRGFVTYSNHSKITMLGVETQTLEKYGAVSKEIALAMVKGALLNSTADLALAVTGIAGPSGGTEEKPVGTVFLAITGKYVKHKNVLLNLTGTRRSIRKKTVVMALKETLDYLTKDSESL